MVQSEELRQFLSLRATNFAVLPDFVWFELYKQEAADAVIATLSVIGDFPEQVIVLKSGSEITNIDPQVPSMTDAMQHSDVARSIREMVETMTGPGRDSFNVHAQLKQRWTNATGQLPSLSEGAAEIMASLPEMAEQMFTPHEIRIIRTGAPYTSQMFASIFGATDQIWETVSERPWQPDNENRTRTYLYRYSLALVVYLLWWINSGSQPRKRLERTRNDLIDLSFAVYGTYYDGLMTADRKANWMYYQLADALFALGVEVPSLR